jgi:hypothetical protein
MKVVFVVLTLACSLLGQTIVPLSGFGFESQRHIADYTTFGFLSETELVVAIKQRGLRGIYPGTDSNGPVRLLLVDTQSGKVKWHDQNSGLRADGLHPVMWLLADRMFLARTDAGFSKRTADNLEIASHVKACFEPERLQVSPRGKNVAYLCGQEQLIVLDENLRVSRKLKSGRFVLGDGIVARRDWTTGSSWEFITLDNSASRPQLGPSCMFNFINDHKLLKFTCDQRGSVIDSQGRELFEVDTKNGEKYFIRSGTGQRFAVEHHLHNFWGSVRNFPDVSGTRQYDEVLIRIYDVDQKKRVGQFKFKPKPEGTLITQTYSTLSPSGRHLAVLVEGSIHIQELK